MKIRLTLAERRVSRDCSVARSLVCVCLCVGGAGGECVCVCVCGLEDLGSRAKRDGCSNSGCRHPPIKLQMLLMSIEKGQGGGVNISMHQK